MELCQILLNYLFNINLDELYKQLESFPEFLAVINFINNLHDDIDMEIVIIFVHLLIGLLTIFILGFTKYLKRFERHCNKSKSSIVFC